MSPANRTILPLALFGLVFLVACGNNNNGPAPNPQGFTNANLTGTYVFFSQGWDSGFAPLTIAGAFASNGSGSITGGAMDAVDPAIAIDTNQAITSGSYFVDSDGRGQAQLVTGIGTFVLDFVLTAGTTGVSSHGLVTEFDSNGSGSGTLDLQTAIPDQSSIAGPFAFTIAGSDDSGNSFASAGAFTLDSSGAITTNTGVQDFSDNGGPFLDQSLTGNALLGSGTSPGTMSLSSTFGTLAFDFYPIDATHFKVVETDGFEFMEGDVFTQNGASIPTGAMAFTMSGGLSTAVGDGGVMTSDGTGNFSAGLEDLNNQGGVTSQQAFTGAKSSGGSVGGRVIVNLTGFSPATQWVIYPSSGGLQILESDALNTTIGTAYGQTSGATLSTTQGYGLNLSAFDFVDGIVENSIAEFASTNGAYTGGIDVNDDNGAGISLNPNLAFAVTFAGPDSTGRGTATTTAGGSAYIGFDYYLVDDSTALFLETDNIQVGTGVFGLQTSAASGVARHGALARAHPQGRAKVPKQVKRQGRYK